MKTEPLFQNPHFYDFSVTIFSFILNTCLIFPAIPMWQSYFTRKFSQTKYNYAHDHQILIKQNVRGLKYIHRTFLHFLFSFADCKHRHTHTQEKTIKILINSLFIYICRTDRNKKPTRNSIRLSKIYGIHFL